MKAYQMAMADPLEYLPPGLFAEICDRHVIAGSNGAVLLGADRAWRHERAGGVPLADLKRAEREGNDFARKCSSPWTMSSIPCRAVATRRGWAYLAGATA
jgi:hypothetical protein